MAETTAYSRDAQALVEALNRLEVALMWGEYHSLVIAKEEASSFNGLQNARLADLEERLPGHLGPLETSAGR